MPLRGGRGDQGKEIVGMTQNRHFCQNPPPIISEIGKVHPPYLGQAARDHTAEPFCRAIPR